MARQRQPDFFGIKLPPVPCPAPAREGWTTWQKTPPQFRLWWRVANWLKKNTTDYFDAAGELVAEERWGVNGNAWRMKKPAKAQQPIPPNYEAAERAAKEFWARKAAEREKRACAVARGRSA